MNQPDQRERSRKFLLILAAGAVPFAAATTLLVTSIFGPGDLGVRCTRVHGASGHCQVLQSRLLGLAGNSAFLIPESDIAGARAICTHRGVGGRAGASCSVDLLLKSGPYRNYPILSYALSDQAAASARKLNDYFTDPARSSIELNDEIGSSLLLAAGAPLLVIVVVLVS
jgi:hypothetical protein